MGQAAGLLALVSALACASRSPEGARPECWCTRQVLGATLLVPKSTGQTPDLVHLCHHEECIVDPIRLHDTYARGACRAAISGKRRYLPSQPHPPTTETPKGRSKFRNWWKPEPKVVTHRA
ncbi:hypothetical protein L202_00206 [Cryptococcus amylolentus CBS 6039]|uniref:Extracellular membrane protein CFEM domain-containing protein n=1 Tax=Cryptococcus amylolentus CBS 6039 TaxID=1295533 RepID=A0A1E3I6M6_9TREE|nr:hypothetical protein L202_00206 [Cryptococcus amylolentus CBS 6039]ODN84207.1 hypothetical protein L202_00206 [Cryptococcus amylolentus CBS 6039]